MVGHGSSLRKERKNMDGGLTVWLSGGRRGETCGAEQLNYRAACFQAAQAARPLEPVLGRLSIRKVLWKTATNNKIDLFRFCAREICAKLEGSGAAKEPICSAVDG